MRRERECVRDRDAIFFFYDNESQLYVLTIFIRLILWTRKFQRKALDFKHTLSGFMNILMFALIAFHIAYVFGFFCLYEMLDYLNLVLCSVEFMICGWLIWQRIRHETCHLLNVYVKKRIQKCKMFESRLTWVCFVSAGSEESTKKWIVSILSFYRFKRLCTKGENIFFVNEAMQIFEILAEWLNPGFGELLYTNLSGIQIHYTNWKPPSLPDWDYMLPQFSTCDCPIVWKR